MKTAKEIENEFAEKFLKDSEHGPELNMPDGTLAFIADIHSFLSTALKDATDAVIVEEKSIPANELMDIVLALRPDSPEVQRERRVRDDTLFLRHYECAVHNAARQAQLQAQATFFADLAAAGENEGV